MDDSTPTTTTPTPGLAPDPATGGAATAAPSSTFGGPTSPPPAAPPPPSWAPTTHHRDGGGRTAGIVFGLILLGLGVWFFADRTLGLDLPDIRWSQLWPLILVVIGLAILVSALRRDRR